MRPRLLAFLLAVVTLSIDAQPAGETVEIRLIEVDAIVTDRDGKAVTGLTAADFELFENGRRQAISNFSEYRERAESIGSTSAATVAVPAPRTIVLFIDAVLAARGEARKELFGNLNGLIAKTMREGDRAQVLVWDDRAGVVATTKLTTNRQEILAAVANAERNVFAAARGVTAEEYARFYTDAAAMKARLGADVTDTSRTLAADIAATSRALAEEELALMHRKTAAMERIVASLAQPNGRSVFVYVSETFPLVAGTRAQGRRVASQNLQNRGDYQTRHLLDAVIRTANANGVSFYGLRASYPETDPIGSIEDDEAVYESTTTASTAIAEHIVMQNEVSALNVVAEQTGGAIGIGPNGVEQAIERIAQDVGSYYTLAYRARSDGSDRERRIEVRPKNRQLVVRTRRSVVEKSDRTRARDLVVARLFERGPSDDLAFDVKVLPAVADRTSQRITFPVELSIPVDQLKFAEENGELAAKFSVIAVSAASLHNAGDVTEQSKRITAPLGEVPEGNVKYSFSLLHDRKPTTLSIAVFDETSGLAGTRQVTLDGGTATVTASSSEAQTATALTEAVARAASEGKLLLAFYRAPRCTACKKFESETVPHPAIQRRLSQFVFVALPDRETSLVLFDQAGTQRAKWSGMPAHISMFGEMLDSMLAAAPNFARAAALNETGPAEGELEAAVALARIGRPADARASIARAMKEGTPKTRQFGVIAGAMMDVSEGKRDQAKSALDKLLGDAISAEVAANAWMGIAMVHRSAGALNQAIEAYRTASSIGGAGSEADLASQQAIAALEAAAVVRGGPVKLVPFENEIVSGRRTVRTNIASADVARVVFTLDGGDPRAVDKPPFSTNYDFGRVPQTRIIRAVAHDRAGGEIGRDEVTVNNAGETFWLRLTEPAMGRVTGTVRVSTTMRTPASRNVKRVVVSWNDVERAVLTAAPWQTQVAIPNEIGVLRAVAELDDGRVTEDAVLLNAGGHVDRAEALLVELPIIVRGDVPKPADVVVSEGRTKRTIETVLSGDDAPLTIGLVIDASRSMIKTLPDVQEAAIRFLETALGPKDRAFLVTFDSIARLVQPPTADRDLLRRQIMAIHPQNLTAMHDALILGLLQFEGVKGRRAIVVFSDGGDTASRYSSDDVGDVAKRSNIPIYVIAAGEPPMAPLNRMAPTPARGTTRGQPGVPLNVPTASTGMIWMRTTADLTRVSVATGGRMHRLGKLEELPEVYREIEADLRAQVLAVIRTDAGKHENDWRAIEVEVTGRKGVRAPSGYYAPW